MWQPESFDPVTIDRELSWAAALGFNSVRSFLHDLAWAADPQGFKQRIDRFLDIASRHGIRPLLVFFDDCWNPDPRIGPQPAPMPGVHNSGWVQSPGARVVERGPSGWSRLQSYVADILGFFAEDDRILLWDLYNEPGNSGNGEKSLPLVKAVFEWARTANPSQPLTMGVWFDNKPLNELQIAQSDIISFHHYWEAEKLAREILKLRTFGRPLICTEWMARTTGSRVETNLPVFAREGVGCFNWGLVAGRTNTIFQWKELLPANASIDPQVGPEVWFHDLLCADGTPYDQKEIEIFKELTGVHRPSSSGFALSESVEP